MYVRRKNKYYALYVLKSVLQLWTSNSPLRGNHNQIDIT